MADCIFHPVSKTFLITHKCFYRKKTNWTCELDLSLFRFRMNLHVIVSKRAHLRLGCLCIEAHLDVFLWLVLHHLSTTFAYCRLTLDLNLLSHVWPIGWMFEDLTLRPSWSIWSLFPSLSQEAKNIRNVAEKKHGSNWFLEELELGAISIRTLFCLEEWPGPCCSSVSLI